MMKSTIKSLVLNNQNVSVITRCQWFSTAHLTKSVQDINDPHVAWENAKPYSSIPGPSIYQIISSSLPAGKYYGLEFQDVFKRMLNDYGNIVKLPGLLGNKEIVFISDPSDFELVFRNEGIWPHRRSLKTFEHYRKNIRPDLFKDMGGLINEQGEQWAKMRSIVNPIMLKPSTINSYIPVVDEITIDFCDQIKESRDNKNELPANFFHDLNAWALESISFIALDNRLHIVGGNRKKTANARALGLIQAVDAFFTLTLEVEMRPSPWQYITTPKYRQLMAALNQITETTMYYIDQAVERLEKNPPSDDEKREPSVFEKLVEVDKHAAVVMAIDMMTAGVDTTSSSMASLLYYLSKNPDKQEKLRAEVKNIPLDENGKLKSSSFAKIPYLRACLKESLRLAPITTGNVRAAGKDIVIKGYQIPQGTDMLMTPILANEEHFKDSNQFIPERWLNEKLPDACPASKASNPFVYLPFGFGSRSCIGKRIAEIEMYALTTRLLKQFQIEFNYGPVKYRSGLVLSPISDLKFKLTDL